MGVFVWTNPKVALGATEISTRVKSAQLNYSADAIETTTAGATTKIRTGGLKDWSLTVTCAQDYAAGNVDATVFPLVGSTVAIHVLPVNTTIAADNPDFTGTGLVTTYNPAGGTVGALAECSFTIVSAGTLDRDVTP